MPAGPPGDGRKRVTTKWWSARVGGPAPLVGANV